MDQNVLCGIIEWLNLASLFPDLYHNLDYSYTFEPNFIVSMSFNRPLIIANWKMNVLPSEAKQLVDDILSGTLNLYKFAVAPPFTHLAFLDTLNQQMVYLAAQDCHEELFGAFTSEISVPMLADLGVKFIIVGHSEKRNSNPLENNRINTKLQTILSHGLFPVYCCGEPFKMREAGEHLDFIKSQLDKDLLDLKEFSPQNLTIAYEPIWAIGTGITASAQQISEMHHFIHSWLKMNFGKDIAEQINILYGGSVKAINAKEIAMIPFVHGALVGGASLNAHEFSQIIKGFYSISQSNPLDA
ncbi:MAG: triose-phosphate isomerase [Saprospiraceae bacterium]|nr:triose-phosphate isomerase [Saprospiraceae bacterium]